MTIRMTKAQLKSMRGLNLDPGSSAILGLLFNANAERRREAAASLRFRGSAHPWLWTYTHIDNELRLLLPFPPSINHYWRHARGRTYISKEGVAFRDTVATVCCRARVTGRLDVMIYLYPSDRRLRDIDNSLKVLLDAIQKAGVYDNDEQIDVLAVRRMPNYPGGKCEVTIRNT